MLLNLFKAFDNLSFLIDKIDKDIHSQAQKIL